MISRSRSSAAITCTTRRAKARFSPSPVLDADNGYVLAPMTRGIRLTTGAEFARRDTPPTPVQIEQTEPIARKLFPLGERLDTKPWMGCRPCLPDMLPIVGPFRATRGCGSISAISITALRWDPSAGRCWPR